MRDVTMQLPGRLQHQSRGRSTPECLLATHVPLMHFRCGGVSVGVSKELCGGRLAENT